MGETTQEVTGGPILGREERRAMVLGFAEAFLQGDVRILYWGPSAGKNLGAVDIRTGKEISVDEKIRSKRLFHEMLSKVCGVTESSPEEVNHAIESMFNTIIQLRAGEFIEGKFLASTRLKSLEDRLTSVEKFLEELPQRLKVQGPS